MYTSNTLCLKKVLITLFKKDTVPIEHSTKPVNGPSGFSTLLENFIERPLDLNELLVAHPAATFFVRATGTSLEGAGIKTNDILIVDRSLFIAHNKLAVIRLQEEFTIKRIILRDAKMFIADDSCIDKPLEITQDTDCEVWGIITFIIHQV